MKITRKHIFIISGIIGLIALVVVIIIKVSNKTCDTSGGKKLYCNNTVCIDCGQGKTYDCDKKICVVPCDTSGGKKLYCNGEKCYECGLNKTYDCIGGKKCICDTEFKECGDNCCPNETTCIKPVGTQATTCCPTEKQCGLNDESGDYTQCCEDSEFCINPSEGSTYCCKGGQDPCGYNSDTKLYTTCCKGDEKCNIDSICELKCQDGKEACGDNCCTTGNCIKPNDGTNPYCCDDGVRCGINSSGDYTICCKGDDAKCGDSGKCEVTCTDSTKTLYCDNTVCATKCSRTQVYDCPPGKEKCICDPLKYPNPCEDGTCCPTGQGCYLNTDNINACCNTDQLCVTQNNKYTQCCDPNSMCVNNKCVKRCALDEEFLDCEDTNLCIKALNLDVNVKNDLINSAAEDENIVGHKVICNESNNCSYCIKNAPKNFSNQEWRYPLKVGNLSVGSYIIGDLGGGGSSNSGYCTYASQDDTDGDKHSLCNRHINGTDCVLNPQENCFWNSFLPQDPATNLTAFYSDLDKQFTNDENNINQYNYQDTVNKYNGVWENNGVDGLSHYMTIKQNANEKKVSISDCIAVNSIIEGISNITYLDNKTNQLCLGGFDFPSVGKKTCTDGVSTGMSCNDNGNITFDTSCKSSCAGTDYRTEKWYNQQRNGIWSCNPLNINLTDMHVEDTVTSYCPDSLCTIKEWMIQDTTGNCGKDERTWDVNDTNLSYIGNLPTLTTLNEYFVTINIINKTQKNMACYCETKNYPSATNATGRYFIPANSSKKIGVQGAQIYNSSGVAPFIIYTCKDEATMITGIDTIANFQIYYDSGCSLNNYTLYQSAITSTLNIKDSVTNSISIYCGVDIVFYPSNFHQELNRVDMYHTVDLIHKKQAIYRIK